jgi:hypothetical protein
MSRSGTIPIDKILGAVFSLLGLFTLLFDDLFTGLVWMLLGNGLLLFRPTVDVYGKKRVEWTFQNIVAVGALVLAVFLTVVILVIDFTG